MADLTPVIETIENRWMRAWVKRDIKTLKAITAKDFIFIVASKPPAILDRPSWLDAAAERYTCSSYRFGDIYVRSWGAFALFTAPVDLTTCLDGRSASEKVWVVDLWRKSRMRGWKLVQRSVSRVDEDPQLRSAIKSLQLWK
jgi:ketosteroid isomerase-like protein